MLQQWERDGLLEIRQEIVQGKTRGRTESCVALCDPDHVSAISGLKPSEKKTLDLLVQLGAGLVVDQPIVPRRELTRLYPGAQRALSGLVAKNLIRLEERPVYRDPFGEVPPVFPRPACLTDEQENALAQLLPAIRQHRFAPFLLHGVTGSGKTEVYLQAASVALAESRSVLVLVPEIALAAHLEGQFLARFGERVALLHSGLSAGERFDQWTRLLRGQAAVVIGARSAVFAPLQDPGLIIVDEEHDGAFKQEEGLRYQARDLAVLRASQVGATVILGSATPSIISYQHAVSGKYQLLNLTKRVEDRSLPAVKIVDLRAINTVSGQPPLFANELVSGLRDNLARGEQSLIFLNRRGYASLMFCRACGQAIQCKHCQVSLTVHKGRGELLCHYCGHTVRSGALCPNCQSDELIEVGFGTERLEAELRKLFPHARLARLDRDTCANRKDYLAVLRAMHEHQIDIMLGTQIIAKGHHFPLVTLVGIIWADAGLGMPDFRAGERTFQLISQVSGRAGRGEQPGRVIIQTLQPDHYSITLAREHDYLGLFNREIALRKKHGFPPYSRLINLRIEGENEDAVQDAARHLAHCAKGLCRNGGRRVEILGPAPAPLARLRGRYRWQFLLKGDDLESLHALAGHLLHEKPAGDGLRGVRISVDVDPENML